MRRYIARGLAIVILVSLGAAQGPTSLESSNTRNTKTKISQNTDQQVVVAKVAQPKPFQVGTAS